MHIAQTRFCVLILAISVCVAVFCAYVLLAVIGTTFDTLRSRPV